MVNEVEDNNANNGAPLSKNARKRRAKRIQNATTGTITAAQGVKKFSNRWMSMVYEEKPSFPEQLFNTMFTKEKIETLVAALKMATEKEVEESNRLLEDDYTYSVQITSHKVPHVPVHLSRVTLKHSLQNEDSEICLFVKDLKRGRRLDFEPTIQHYEKLLQTKNIKHKITIIPINQLYNEFSTFELRRKLSYLYDKFLVDSAVAAHVNGFLGSKLMKKGRLAIPVNMSKENLGGEIDLALRKVFYKHVNRGITQNVQVGKHSMSNEQIAENIIDLLHQFGNVHPGGYKNVHKLFLRPQVNISVSIALYVSLEKPEETVPGEKTNKDEFLQNQSEKAAETLEKFDINAAGKLVQRRHPTCPSIISEDLLLSEDEEDGPELPKKAKLTERVKADGGSNATATATTTTTTASKQTKESAAPSAAPAAPPVKRAKFGPGNDSQGNSGNVKRRPPPQKQQQQQQQHQQQQQQQQQNRGGNGRNNDNFDLNAMRMDRRMDFSIFGQSGGSYGNRDFGNDDFTRRPIGGNNGDFNRSGDSFGNNNFGNQFNRLFNNRF